jgi:hypothetical protein
MPRPVSSGGKQPGGQGSGLSVCAVRLVPSCPRPQLDEKYGRIRRHDRGRALKHMPAAKEERWPTRFNGSRIWIRL